MNRAGEEIGRNMNAILSRVFRAPLFRRETAMADTWQTIDWWEVCRIPFNLIIGIVGTVILAMGGVAMSVTNAFLETPIHRPDPPLFLFALLYAVVVDFFYTGGGLAELFCRRLWPSTPCTWAPSRSAWDSSSRSS